MNNPEAHDNFVSEMVHHRHDLEEGYTKPDRNTSIGAFGVDLSHFTHRTQFIIAASIMFTVFILFGYVQESIFRTEGFTFGLFITCVQYTMYTIFAYIQGVITKDTKPRAKMSDFFKIAMFQVTSVSLSNIATVYLNYPTKVLFKTSKIIPVMIMGRLFFGKHYLFIQWVATTLLLVGISLFSLADSVVFPNFTWKGIIYMCASLAAESMGHNVTESIMVKNNCTEREVIFFNGIFGSFFTFTALMLSGEFQAASTFCGENPEIYFRIFILSILGYVGGSYSLALTKSFGIFSTMTVATCRKLTTIVLSFLIFPKPFVFAYFYAGLLAFAGISLNIYVKNSQEVKEWLTYLKDQVAKLKYNNKSTI